MSASTQTGQPGRPSTPLTADEAARKLRKVLGGRAARLINNFEQVGNCGALTRVLSEDVRNSIARQFTEAVQPAFQKAIRGLVEGKRPKDKPMWEFDIEK